MVHSIRARMTAGFALAIALLMLMLCGGLSAWSWREADHDARTRLAVAAAKVRDELGGGAGAPGDLSELLEEERDLRHDSLAMLVIGATGHVEQQSQRSVPAWPRRADGWRTVTLHSGRRTLVIGLPWWRTAQTLHRQDLELAGLGAIVVAAAALGSWLLVGRTLSPIGRLARQAADAGGDRAADSLRLRLTAPSRDAEVVHLVATLNGLLDRLAQTAEARGRFYAAASHELRTPLQALKGHLQLALSRERAAPEYRAALEEAASQADRLTSLVRDLLLLNRLEHTAGQPLAAECVDLADVCATVLEQFEPVAAQRGLHVHADLSEPLEILAPPMHAEMLVRNLMENAVKYAREGGSVKLAAAPGGHGAARVEVYNDADVPAEWDTERLFEPFYRPDASRSAKTGGNGLGLAICRAIAATNGWSLTLERQHDGVRATLKTGSRTSLARQDKGPAA